MLSNLKEALGFKLEASTFLYVLCEYETLLKKNISLESFVNLCKSMDVKLIQYIDKISSIQTQKENLIFLKNSIKIPIIVNNRIELVEYCDGLYLDEENLALIHKDKKLAIKLIRRIIGKKLLGLLTFNEVEILEANELEIDMIDVGRYKKINTKDIDYVLNEKIVYLSKISVHLVCIFVGIKTTDKIKNITFDVVRNGLNLTKRNTYGKN